MDTVTFFAGALKPKARAFLRHRFTICSNKLHVMVDEAIKPVTFLGFKLPIRKPTADEARRAILNDPNRNPYLIGSQLIFIASSVANAPDDVWITMSYDAFIWLATLP